MLSSEGSTAALIRSAVPDDATALYQLIVELAAHEGLAGELKVTGLHLSEELSRARPTASFLIAEQAERAVGFCAWYHGFSTFEGRPTLFVEDVFVRAPARRQGIGGALLRKVATLAAAEGLPRIEWRVQRSNEAAIGLFERSGFPVVDDWKFCRVSPTTVLTLE
ncbi:GNAT family N-acetyltransferase [Sphingomonas asaccharolytica]|uniref:GNAT family N-acetyltransferase n=1 Tax=Sphingomonas asaccharolytica TaxID=40681 RepID=UPI0008303BDD|nr:GNAT family N-acetyltransferase [Sphingomonas asaccharolytica]